jgi:hypothetical protein
LLLPLAACTGQSFGLSCQPGIYIIPVGSDYTLLLVLLGSPKACWT